MQQDVQNVLGPKAEKPCSEDKSDNDKEGLLFFCWRLQTTSSHSTFFCNYALISYFTYVNSEHFTILDK